MVTNPAFLFSIAGLSASFAGLAGLVAGLRRGTDLRLIDQFRLRQIVEFAFVNITLAVGYLPLVTLMQDEDLARRVFAVLALVALVGHFALLRTRALGTGVRWAGTWLWTAGLVNAAALATCIWLVVTPTEGVLELLLLLFLSRPMLAFSLVLGSMESGSAS